MVIGTDSCSFELYIINDGTYRDYDLGDRISPEPPIGGYDCFHEDVCECDLAGEIAERLYETTEGQFRYVIHVDLAYTQDPWDGEYDMEYAFTVESKEPTVYFDTIGCDTETHPDNAPSKSDVPEEDVEWLE